jgi:hypothetical protein
MGCLFPDRFKFQATIFASVCGRRGVFLTGWAKMPLFSQLLASGERGRKDEEYDAGNDAARHRISSTEWVTKHV